LIICPSCGSTVKADLCLGCPYCKARAIGPPLAKAEHELPSFGRAALVFAIGLAVVSVFLGLLVASLIENKSSWFSFWKIVSAGEVAAWRLKWAALPVAALALISGARVIRSIRLEPARFMGLPLARIGLVTTAAVTVVVALLIGVTIPDRLRQRQYALEAADNAHAYTMHRALLDYRDLHGTFPPDPDKYIEALRTLPDPDGSIADALRFVDANGYQATAQIAVAPKTKPLVTRGIALRNVSSPANPEPPVLSFTTYDLRMKTDRRWYDSLWLSDEGFTMHNGWIDKSPGSSSSLNPSRTRVP